MGIKGFQGTSLLDFPGRIASLVFLGGCNLTCPFCHNPPLVLEPDELPDLDLVEILANLSKRSSFIDGVVISGGEPTLEPGLSCLLKKVKAMGLAVKLDTNGLAPQVLRELVRDKLVDYLAIDLKTMPERYPQLHSGPVEFGKLLETIRFCSDAPIEIEYRTTCVPGWVDNDVIRGLGSLINGAPLWVLQQFHAEYALCDRARETENFGPKEIYSFASVAEDYVENVVVRGV